MLHRAMLQVAVVGAGAAGLCIGRHLIARPDVFSATIFEQTNRVGGTWVYSEQTGVDSHGLPVHSSMYSNLKTNLPKQVMAFPDYAFADELNSYLMHTEVCKYLEDYAEHFSVIPQVEFNTSVELVRPIGEDEEKPKWEVTVKNIDNLKQSTRVFDAVVVCNGHYSIPRKPNIPGMDQFPGLIMHSHDYRHPEKFAGMNVALLGAGSSGQDIALDLTKIAQRVFLSHRKNTLLSKLPENLEQHQGIKELFPDGRVLFEDGQERKVGGIILCTGYDFSFPFLDPKCGITVEDNHITPLYKHLFNIEYPSMAFIGLPYRICPFPQFHLQSEYIVSMLTGKVCLPSKAEMLADMKESYENIIAEGLPKRYAHFLGSKQWEYNNMIADLAKCDSLPLIVEKLYQYTWEFRNRDVMNYKNREFKATSESTFEEIPQIPSETA